MFFIDELKKIVDERNIKHLGMFVDMDGVIADYRFGEGKNIINNIPNTYASKRPIKTTINNLKKISNEIKCDINIISSCLYNEQKTEKINWLDKNVPFISKENIYIINSKDFEARKEIKVDEILEVMKKKQYDYSILIDDTHEILFLALKKGKGKIIPIHVITILD